eukprot:CAMPEP_0174247152 /NCGR_PEP_ID=MMETSP0417-20130205/42428_1 /TAXON_ID=242541 /ORGANISM="Mayorella sp, Strain BSH-02190019" /LENGTH=544 /DNA_ID=CAMNT_0015327005 /DNA_START=38 /DNA_END=1672 /DNA_ORIENTATION=-
MTLRVFLVVLVLVAHVFITSAVSLSVSSDAPSLVRLTEQGPVRGKYASREVLGFFGIPFAAPPLDELRFALPMPPVAWGASHVLDATSFRLPCAQRPRSLLNSSEDCLYLNVYTPLPTTPTPTPTIATGAAQKTPLLPTMVWIHGGAYTQGGPQTYNASSMAALGRVVVVTIAYRLGVFGFAAFDSPTTAANVGLFDQQAALRWVQRNIASFGGDPQRVTVFGESAGGGSAIFHLLQRDSWPLIHRAVAESPGVLWIPSLERTRNATREFASMLGCEDLACMRSLSQDRLLSLPVLPWGATMAFMPTLDGPGGWFEDQPFRMLESGRWHQVPLVLGWNAQEQNLFGAINLLHKPPLTPEQYRAALNSTFGGAEQDPYALAPIVERIYAEEAAQLGLWQAYSRAVADFCLLAHCPSVIEPALRQSSSPVFMYFFNYLPLAWVFQSMGCTHTAEIPFVFADPNVEGMVFDRKDRAFADSVSQMWSSFAANGSSPTALWPDYREEGHCYTLGAEATTPGAFPYNSTACNRLADVMASAAQYPRASVW